MLTGLDHVVIAVADLERASETYAALLGLSPSWRGTHPGQGTANTLFRLANTYVELLTPAGEGPLAAFLRDRLATEGEGPLALAFGTEDAQAAAASLTARAISVSELLEGRGKEQRSGRERSWLSFRLAPEQTRGMHLMVVQHVESAGALPISIAHAPVSSAVAAVDHVVVMTGDPQAAITLYRDALGLRLALDRTFEARGLRLLFFRVGGVTVECAAPLADSESFALARDAAEAGAAGSDRFWGVSYRVPDVAAARERLTANGFDVSEIRKGMKPGTTVCTVRSETHGVATLLLGPE